MTKGYNIYDSTGAKIGRALIDESTGSTGGWLGGGFSFSQGVMGGLGFILMLLPPMWIANGLWEKSDGLGKFGLNRTSLVAIPVSVLTLIFDFVIGLRLFDPDGPMHDWSLVDIFAGAVVWPSAFWLMFMVPCSLVSLLFVGLAEKIIAMCGALVTLITIAALLRIFF